MEDSRSQTPATTKRVWTKQIFLYWLQRTKKLNILYQALFFNADMPVVWQETSTFCKITQGLSNKKNSSRFNYSYQYLILTCYVVFSSKELRVYNQQVLVSFQREGQRCWEDKARLCESAWDGKLLESTFSSPSLVKMGFKHRTSPSPDA